MWTLARASIAHHRRSFAGVIVAVLLASALSTALGVLVESGLRGGVPVERLAGADVVVGAPQSKPVPEDVPVPFSERALLDDDTVDAVAAVPGVNRAIADVEVPLTAGDGIKISAHPWAAAALTPSALTAGESPAAADQVVVDSSLGAEPGDRIELAHGGVPATYTVSGIVDLIGSADAASLAYLSPQAIGALWPHAGSVALIGVIADEGTDAAALSAAIADRVPGVVTYVGAARGDVESLAGVNARTNLIALSGSLAGVALIIAMFVVASTLSLSIAQRRRDFALLRAVGTSPRQLRGIIVRETALVSTIAAVIGALPGYALAQLLADQFAVGGVIPADFALAFSPLAGIAAVALTVGTAALAAIVSARGPSKAPPIEALVQSRIETPQLNRGRVITGLSLIITGVVASLLPLVIRGEAALAGPASAALLITVGAALIGPRIVEWSLTFAGPVLRRLRVAPGVLADANARSFTRRLSTAIIPLALGITLAIVQLFVPATVSAEAATQHAEGTTADYIVTSPAGGIAPELGTQVAAIDGVDAVTPVIRSNVIVATGDPDSEFSMVQPKPIQGIDPAASGKTLDLAVTDGSLAKLADPDTVALGSNQAFELGAHVGDSVDLTLGDGTPLTARVVAIYDRGLGFGAVTIDADALRPHTTTGLADHLLVSGTGDAVAGEITALGLSLTDASDLGAAGAGDAAQQSWASVIALLVILGFIALAVVNTLVMATTERRDEFALLRRLGATPGQVTVMTFLESGLISVLAVVLGTVITLPPLIGIAFGLTGQPIPVFPPIVYGMLAGSTLLLGILSIVLPTRSALRAPLVSAV
ncbi:ABC transporter permease [Microbacterium sp. MPKO10]|uniref:ABC transporter permease n=1 Tax=Microbacterium sp. MPKO10 TaxID=2989818 RepID=UPI0022366E37|nr:ABC transporter permease [Microbacterium sp. MPKO10]MCW4458632.1 ABC transporter permease [Microbacterium sp. MPKO10]